MTSSPECGKRQEGEIPSHSFCPYVGLQPYTEDDREYFFGRDREQRVICSNLYAAPLTVLYGASGVGKSSVLRAGVVPRLQLARRTAVVYFNQWQSPKDSSFLSELKFECLKVVERQRAAPLSIGTARTSIEFLQDPAHPPELVERVKGSISLPFHEFLRNAAAQLKGALLIVLDQFEEYFLYHPELESDSNFDAEFASAVNSGDAELGFVIALRDDWLSRLDRFQGRIPNLLSNTYRLEHLSAAAAEDAIRKPLEVYNKNFANRAPVWVEDKLVWAVLSQVRAGQLTLSESAGTGQAKAAEEGDRIETAFLQLVMTRLWSRELQAGSHSLQLGTFDALGGAKQIVQSHLDDVMKDLPPAEQEICARIFRYLVTPKGAKIAHETADLVAFAERPLEQVTPLLEKLNAKRVLRRISPPERYEIFHDVLAPAILDWRARYVKDKEKAEAELQAAEQLRAANRLRRLAWGLGAMLLLALVAIGFAFWQRAVSRAGELVSASVLSEETDSELAVLIAAQAVAATWRWGHSVLPEAETQLYRSILASHLRLTLTGQFGFVRAVAWSPDGKLLAVGSGEKGVKVWDAEKGKELLTLGGNGGTVESVAWSPDGKRMATGNGDNTANVWQAEMGKELVTLRGHSQSVKGVAWSPDGRRLATASEDGTAKVWDAETGSELLTVRHSIFAVSSVAWSPEGKRLATGSDDHTAKVWATESGKELLILKGHSNRVNSVAWSPDGKRLATASDDDTAKVWDMETGKELLTLTGHKEWVDSVAWSPDGKRLATGSHDDTAKVWDAETGKELLTFVGHEGKVNSVAWSPDGKRLATGSDDDTAKVWAIESKKELLPLSGHCRDCQSVAWSPDGKRLATGSEDDTAKVWDAETGKELLTLGAHNTAVLSVAWSPDGKRLAAGSAYGTAKVWDAETGKELLTLSGHGNRVEGVAWSPDGKRLATGSLDNTAKVWDAETGNVLLTLSGHYDSASRVAWSPDGRRLVAGGVWDAATWKELLALGGYGVAWSPDGRRLAGGTPGWSTAEVWDAATGKELVTLTGHRELVFAVSWNPDGRRLATGSVDGTARVWDAGTGKELLTLSPHNGEVTSVAWSPDGKRLATATAYGTVQVYAIMDIRDLMALARQRVTSHPSQIGCKEYIRRDECPPFPEQP